MFDFNPAPQINWNENELKRVRAEAYVKARNLQRLARYHDVFVCSKRWVCEDVLHYPAYVNLYWGN